MKNVDAVRMISLDLRNSERSAKIYVCQPLDHREVQLASPSSLDVLQQQRSCFPNEARIYKSPAVEHKLEGWFFEVQQKKRRRATTFKITKAKN